MARYIAIFNLPKPTYEHAQIDGVIGECCGGDFKKVVLGGSTVVYLFDSSQAPHTLDFSKILHAADEVAFFEVGDYFSSTGFRTLSGWLNSHRNR
jgi:hypothetical protein